FFFFFVGCVLLYQSGGGPSFAQCYQLVRDACSEPAMDTQHLLRWQIFNVLVGNSDGHAKNLSLLHLLNGETRLAPFYMICIAPRLNGLTIIWPSMSVVNETPA
ncbi:MAG: HipA domain-containing protein, partial [Candidatus Competibacteraceae bacterium]|nr:HipA domain-containing protein [Candidatus Competibacteraceae bacterium]